MPPNRPKIYHITHLENLAQMVDGVIWSDAERLRRKLDCKIVGMSEIKRRRLEELQVECHPGSMVGDYVPFYFCFRSVMLYLLHKGNHPDLSYREGQTPIVHLEADLHNVVDWADSRQRPWAFSKTNAGAKYTRFFNKLDILPELNWQAIAATDWRDSMTKEAKQAEFLLYQEFPWAMVERIGVISDTMSSKVKSLLDAASYQPSLAVQPDWYY